jgi:hypothetical protein
MDVTKYVKPKGWRIVGHNESEVTQRDGTYGKILVACGMRMDGEQSSSGGKTLFTGHGCTFQCCIRAKWYGAKSNAACHCPGLRRGVNLKK